MSIQDYLKDAMTHSSVRFAPYSPSLEDYVFYANKAGEEYNPNLNGEDSTKPNPTEMLETICVLCISQEGFLDSLRKKFNISKSFDMAYYDNFSKHSEALALRLRKNGAKKGTVSNVLINRYLFDPKTLKVPSDLLKAIRSDFDSFSSLYNALTKNNDCFAVTLKAIMSIGTLENTNEAEIEFEKLLKTIKSPFDTVDNISDLAKPHLGTFMAVFPMAKEECRNKLGSTFYGTVTGLKANLDVKEEPVSALTEQEMEGLMNFYKAMETKVSTTFSQAIKTKDSFKSINDANFQNIITKVNYLYSYLKHSRNDFVHFQWDCFVDFLHGYIYGRFITSYPFALQEYFFHTATAVLKYIDLSIDD